MKRWAMVAVCVALLLAVLGIFVATRGGARVELVAAERDASAPAGVHDARELEGPRTDTLDAGAALPAERSALEAVPASPGAEEVPAADVAVEVGWGRLALTVLGEPGREPLPGLVVDIAAPSAGADEQVVRGRHETDGAGRIAKEVRAGLALVVEVRGIGVKEPLAVLELEPLAPDEQRALEVLVDDARVPRFWVRLVAAEDGAPLPGARVLEVDVYGDALDTGGPIDAARWSERAPLATADERGLVRLGVSPQVQKRFAALSDGRGPAFFVQERAGERPEAALEVRLARAASLEVTVVDAGGRPLVGAGVRIDGEYAELGGPGRGPRHGLIFGRHATVRTSDAAGRARFDDLPAGAPLRAALLATGPGAQWQDAPEPLSAFAPGERRELTLVARRPTDVHGVALDQHGAPAAGLELLLLRDTGDVHGYLGFHQASAAERTTKVQDDGRFRFDAVPAGRWLVTPRALRDINDRTPHGGVARLEGLFAPVPTAFELSGDEPSHDLALVLWRDLYVRGVVEGGAADARSEAILIARLGDEGGIVLQRAEDDATFAVGPLPGLALELHATDMVSGAKSAKVACRPGDEDVVLALHAGGTLLVHMRNAATGEEVACQLSALRTDAAGLVVETRGYGTLRGELAWRGLTPGTWSLLARSTGDLAAFAAGIEVTAETVVDVELALERGGTLVVTRPPAAAPGAAPSQRTAIVRFAGLPVAERALAPGATFELTLPPGEVEVVERAEGGTPVAVRPVILSPGERTSVVLDG